MGDLQVTSPRVNGVVFGEDRLCSSPPSPPLPVSHPDPSLVAADAWLRAEKTTYEILRRIQPTLGADRRRREVVDYVQRLIRYGAGCEVYPYGSVPLKTYLPDGDIDLTALRYQSIEDGLVSDVHAVLRAEEINEAAEYEVKDIRFIDAEVKLVKCIVQNIVVDISFNQLGGLSTLCFLEKVDRLVGKDHLFKRSIILIKAWCYYESRILGAHHGLISTYALETLVLYIFHQYHLSLDGPLVVLYRFLDYFSKFDWDNYCVSLKGPVGKSSLPEIVVEVPENGGNTLLTEEFIRNCVESFSVPSRGLDSNLRAFPQKHLNIIDPLKENNNLGRSVNRGNFYRIRSAFKYGARKLGWILMLPEDRIEDELNRFFANTLDRHGSTQWYDMQTPSLAFSARGFDFSSSTDHRHVKIDTPGNEHNCENTDERERYLVKDVSSLPAPSLDSSGDRNAVASCKLEDSKNVGTSGVLGIASTNGSSYSSNVGDHLSNSVSEKHPMHSTLGLLRENGKAENRISCSETALSYVIDDEKEKHIMVNNSLRSHIDEKNMASYGSVDSKDAANILENTFSDSDRYTTSVSGGTEASKSLLDLTGDYDSHIKSLQYGQMCNGYAVSPLVVPSPPRSPKFQNRNPWETVRQCLQVNHNIHSHTNSNGVVGQQLYLVNHPTLPVASFGSEEKRKLRGTGAYFPNMTSRPYRDRPMPARGRNQASGIHGQLQRHARSSGPAPAPQESNLSTEGSNELAQEGFPVLGNAKARSSEAYFSQPSMWGSHYADGLPQSSEKYEPGSVSPQLWGPQRTEVSSYPDQLWGPQRTEVSSYPDQLHGPQRTEVSSYPESGISTSRGSVPSKGVVAEEGSDSLSGVDHKRADVQAYHLKNEDDFPPLSH